MNLQKKDKDAEFWPRLLLDKVKEKTNVKIDWDRYVDEDEAKGGFNTDDLDGGRDFGGMVRNRKVLCCFIYQYADF